MTGEVTTEERRVGEAMAEEGEVKLNYLIHVAYPFLLYTRYPIVARAWPSARAKVYFVYKIPRPHRRARPWPSARASKGILHITVSCIQHFLRLVAARAKRDATCINYIQWSCFQ